jgi:hypothetical protein
MGHSARSGTAGNAAPRSMRRFEAESFGSIARRTFA